MNGVIRKITVTVLNAVLVAILAAGIAGPAGLRRAAASLAPGPDPIATVDGLFAALNRGDAAAAAAFYADNAVSGDAVGKDAIRAKVELGITVGFKHTRISGQVFDDGHVEVVDEVRGPFHALVTRTYEFDGAGRIVFTKELRSTVLSDDAAAPSQQQATGAPNTGTGQNRGDRDGGVLPLALLALGVCVAAVGVGVRAWSRRAQSP